MLRRLNTAITRLYEVFKLSIALFRMWPFFTWLNFWTTHKAETTVVINDIKVAIRTKSMFTKAADISMAYECILRDDYQIKNLRASKGSVVLDIGSHIGSFSLAVAKKHPDIKIFSFEPSPYSYKILKKNIELNNYQNIVPFNKAVTSNGRNVAIYFNPLNSAADSLYKRNSCYIVVPSISLEKIFQKGNIKKCAFLKMDCEGAEYDIILNTPIKILQKVERMILEYHQSYFEISNKNYTLPKMINHLELAGFTCNVQKMKSYQGLIIAKRL